jgi:hypothetical protein
MDRMKLRRAFSDLGGDVNSSELDPQKIRRAIRQMDNE